MWNRRVADSDLRNLITQIFIDAGMPDTDAAQCADVLVSADLRGVSSHGVANLPRQYLGWIDTNVVNPVPRWKTVHERPATATIDADRGLGVVVAPHAMRVAIDKARQYGVGMVTVTNGRHLGMAAYHAMLPLDEDMIGICMTAVGPRVVPPGGREPRLGTNPIAFAAPARRTRPFVYDASTSTIAHGKLRLAYENGTEVPGGLYGTVDGNPVLTPSVPPAELTLLPLGSILETGSHKGYGLGAMVEILCSVLSGSVVKAVVGHGSANHFLAAIDVSGFTSIDKFTASIDQFHETLMSTTPAPGSDRVLVPGQLEWETEDERRRNGIPLPPGTIAWLRKTVVERGLEMPSWLASEPIG